VMSRQPEEPAVGEAARHSPTIQWRCAILGYRSPNRTPGQAQDPRSLSTLDLVGFDLQSVNLPP
jgi:hypothetical protein